MLHQLQQTVRLCQFLLRPFQFCFLMESEGLPPGVDFFSLFAFSAAAHEDEGAYEDKKQLFHDRIYWFRVQNYKIICIFAPSKRRNWDETI